MVTLLVFKFLYGKILILLRIEFLFIFYRQVDPVAINAVISTLGHQLTVRTKLKLFKKPSTLNWVIGMLTWHYTRNYWISWKFFFWLYWSKFNLWLIYFKLWSMDLHVSQISFNISNSCNLTLTYPDPYFLRNFFFSNSLSIKNKSIRHQLYFDG